MENNGFDFLEISFRLTGRIKPATDDEIRIRIFEVQLWFSSKEEYATAMTQSLAYINEGYSDIVDIDLNKFFDEVAHYKIL